MSKISLNFGEPVTIAQVAAAYKELVDSISFAVLPEIEIFASVTVGDRSSDDAETKVMPAVYPDAEMADWRTPRGVRR